MKWLIFLQALSFFLLTFSTCLVWAGKYSTDTVAEGCFQLVNASEIISPGNYKLSKLTTYKCVVLCAAANPSGKLAGLTNGNLCVCLKSVTDASSTCDQNCTGDPARSCGGRNSYDVFNLSTTFRHKPLLEFKNTPKFLEQTEFRVVDNDTSKDTSNDGAQLIYGSEALLDEFPPFNVYHPYYFRAYGDMKLTMATAGKLRQEFHETVQVDVPVNVSDIRCPTYIAVGLPIECSGRLELGKEVNITWDFGGGLSGFVHLADPVSWFIGDPVPHWNITDSGLDLPDGLVISLTSGVTQPVLVYAWEMNVNKSGIVDIVVLRPSCGVGMVFCPVSKSCCQMSYEFTSELCNKDTFFCGTTNIGLHADNCTSSEVNTPLSLSNNYKVVYNATYNLKAGFNLKVLPPDERFDYLPGDILAWMKISSGATFGLDPSRGEFVVLENVTSTPTNDVTLPNSAQNKKQAGSIFIAGVATKPNEFLININSQSQPGRKSLTITHKENVSSVTTVRTVSVLHPIGNVTFASAANNSCAIYGPLGEAFNVSIQFERGTDAQVTWKVNGHKVETFPYLTLGNHEKMNWTQNFTFSSLGEYPLVVMLANGVSGKVLTANIIIQEKIDGLKASRTDKKKTYQGLSAQLNASISAGTNVTYKWYFGDGSDVVTTTSSTVDHSYHKLGMINTTVEATNMVSSRNYSFIVEVSNPVEITVPPYGESNVSTNITCRLANISHDNYVIALQIGNASLSSTNCSTIQHVFTPGLHDIYCYIHVVVLLSANTSLYVLERIAGLSILNVPPLPLNASHMVEANITAGNNVSYIWQALGQSYNAYLSSNTSVNFTKTGRIKLSLNASNAISTANATTMVTVQEPIRNLMVNASSNPAKNGSEIKFHITQTAGSEMNYTVNISRVQYVIGSTSEFPHTFTQEGIHRVFVHASNLISTSNTTYMIAVQIPVVHPPEITCPSVSRESKSCVVPASTDLVFTAKIPYATNVTFSWTWGICTVKKDNDASVDSNITSSRRVKFSVVEKCNISVTAENNVSRTSDWMLTEILDNVTGFTFQAPEVVEVNKSFSIKTNISSGTNVSYSFNPGDNRGKEITVVHENATWNYTKTGVYYIKGNASNLVSFKTYVRRITVQQKVSDVIFPTIPTVQTHKVTTITWEVINGTNVTCNITFGYVNSLKQVILRSDKRCTFVATNVTYKCSYSHKWTQAGTYKVTIVAYNLLSTSSKSINALVQDPVDNLSVEVHGSGPYYQYTEILLTFSCDGSDVKYKVHLQGDGEVVKTVKSNFTIKYFSVKKYTPYVTAYNDISRKNFSKLTIDVEKQPRPKEIENLKISAKPTSINSSTTFEVTFTAGALFDCKIDFGDKRQESHYREDEINKGVSYNYSKIGEYTVELRCWNNVGNERNEKTASTVLFVQTPIQGFAVKDLGIVFYRAEIDVTFTWVSASYMNVIVFSKNSTKQVTAAVVTDKTGGSETIRLPSDYFASPGQYFITVNASNKISSESVTSSVRIIEKIEGVQILVNPFVSFNYTVRAYLNVGKGSDMNVTWNFGDGSRNSTTFCQWKKTCSQDHRYTKVGNYRIKARAVNKFKEQNFGDANSTVTIEHPVIGWNFAPVNARVVENIQSKLQLIHDGNSSLPTNAKYSFTFPPAPESEFLMVRGRSIDYPHTFEKAGCYKVKAKIENKVSTVILRTDVKVRGDYGQPKITAKSKKPGSVSGSTLPLEYPVHFTSNVDNDCLMYNWTISNHSKIFNKKSFEHLFQSPGTYSINFTAYDNEDNIPANTIIYVDRSVSGLYFSSDGVGQVNRTVKFILVWKTIGTNTSFTVDYGDGRKGRLNLENKIENWKSQPKNLPFKPDGLTGIEFGHNFTRKGTYNITLRVKSGSEVQPHLMNNVDIEEKPCPLPVILVSGGNKNGSRAPQVPYDSQYTLFAKVDRTECSDKMKIDFKWNIFKADEDLLKSTGSSVLPPDKALEQSYSASATNQPTLYIPKKSLKPGLYMFQLSCRFPSKSAKSQHIVFIQIQRPELVVVIRGGNARSIAWNRPFTLNASDSMDPSVGSNAGLTFRWSCKVKDSDHSSGGCFGAGEQLPEYESTAAVIRARRLLEGLRYQFTVTVSSGDLDGKSGNYTQEINAIPGKPPQLRMRCVSNCAPKVNPEARLTITSECYDNCVGLKYKWSLDSTTSSKTTKDIWPNKTLTDIRSNSLVVKAGTFEKDKEYIFKLKVTNNNEKEGFVTYKVVTNSPPFNGTCDFQPKNGISRKTNFNFTCRDWEDDNPDDILWYKVFYSFGEKENKRNFLLYHGPQSSVSDLKLPAGQDKNNTINLSIHVEDAFKAYSSVAKSVKVVQEKVNLAELQNSTDQVGKILASGDLQAANRLAVALMTEASSTSVNATEDDKKKKEEIFTTILTNINENLPDNLDSMKQSIETISVAVTLQDDLPQATQVHVLDSMRKTSQKLKAEAAEDLGSDFIEEFANEVLSSLDGVLRASSKRQAEIRKKQENNETVPSGGTESINNNVNQTFQVIDVLSSSVLQKKVADEDDVTFKANGLETKIRRSSSRKMNGSSLEFSQGNSAQNPRISFPLAFDVPGLGSDIKVVDVVGLQIHNNPYLTSNTSKSVDSSTISLELRRKNGAHLKVANLSEDLLIVIPREVPENERSENENENKTISLNKTETKISGLVVHVLELNSKNNAFVVEIESDEKNASITIFCRRNKAPTLEKFDFNHTFTGNSTLHKYFLGNDTINGEKYYVGVGSRRNGESVSINYTFKPYEIGCYYWRDKETNWATDGCKPSSNSSKDLVHCLCNHATLFGSNFFVAPNKLDVGAQIANLQNIAKYPALLATICVIGGLYLLGMIWALRKDRQKLCKATLHCAADNDPYDNHRYEVTLFTGSRRNAGSTAEASVIISGDNGDSEPRLLQRTSSVSFKRTSQDSYLVSTSYSLGSLQYIRIWHDNSGSDPSWFLSEVIIRDVESGEQYFFLCNSWLACDEGDGLVERLIPVAGPEELKDFQYLFMQNSTQGFSDGHLWFSIVLRPAQSRFTHAQRITCCLCLLLCTMLVNAMFFKVPVAKENNVDVDVGPYQFTWHEVMVGIQSSLIVFPINLLIVTIFRRIAVRPTKSSKYVSGNSKQKNASGIAISLRDIEMERNKKKTQKKADETPQVETQSPVSRMRLFPWWFVFIAWFLVIAVSATAGFFTILYGLQFGKRRQEQWLTALVISVFQDILVSQPIKIFALSLFVAFVIKKPNNVDVNEENDKLIQNEEWIQESLDKANADGIVRQKTERKPPDELILRKMRLFRQKERKMFGVLREVMRFFFFWWIVLMIAYGYREPDAHRLATSMAKTFGDLDGHNHHFHFKRGSLKHDIYLTRNKRDLLMWVKEIIIPGLYHETWYNNMTDGRDNIISDGVGYLIGSPRLRLLRIKKDTCDISKEFRDKFDGCESEYSFFNEYREKHNYENWVPFNGSYFKETEENYKWQYRSQSELYERPYWADLATYRGGGYVLKLSKNQAGAINQLQELSKTCWIDGETRAVFVEFTMFYPSKNLHCIVTILFECPASGGCTANFQILATRLDELIGNYRIFVLACELIFIISIAYFTYRAVKDLLKQGFRFWYQFWNWIEMFIIATGWTCLAFYILRFIANKWTKAKFHENRGNFVSFRYVATADQLYGVVLAFLVFLTSIKFIRLFRFNRRMSLLGSTLKYAAWDMFNFLVLFAVAFIACCSVAYLLFQTNIDMFSSILMTTQTLLNIILGKFKYMNLSHDTFVASAVVLAVYCIVVVFLLMNVFLVILNDAFKVVKSNNDLQENEHEIVDYMMSRFKSWLGFRSRPSQQKSDFEHEYGFKPTYVPHTKKKYQVPATAVLDRKLQELLDFVDKQAYRDHMENIRVDEFEDEATKKKALLLLMS